MYDFDRDQVNPVSSIRSIKLQRIIPRYELSTSDTRDEGVGPVCEINPAVSGRTNPPSTPVHTRKVKAKKVIITYNISGNAMGFLNSSAK